MRIVSEHLENLRVFTNCAKFAILCAEGNIYDDQREGDGAISLYRGNNGWRGLHKLVRLSFGLQLRSASKYYQQFCGTYGASKRGVWWKCYGNEGRDPSGSSKKDLFLVSRISERWTISVSNLSLSSDKEAPSQTGIDVSKDNPRREYQSLRSFAKNRCNPSKDICGNKRTERLPKPPATTKRDDVRTGRSDSLFCIERCRGQRNRNDWPDTIVSQQKSWQYAGDRGVDTNQLFDVEFRDLPMGFRLYVTTNVRKFVDAGLSLADVYGTMVLGEEAYGTVKLDAMPARVIQKQPGTSGIYDPLDQAASIGWKAAHACVRLNEANMVRIEHVASSNNMG